MEDKCQAQLTDRAALSFAVSWQKMLPQAQKALPILFLGVLFSAFAGAAQPVKCGIQWINIHKNNPDLVGVYVQQSPDNKADEVSYKGRHPSMVVYVFKGGRIHQVEYTPSGQIESVRDKAMGFA